MSIIEKYHVIFNSISSFIYIFNLLYISVTHCRFGGVCINIPAIYYVYATFIVTIK